MIGTSSQIDLLNQMLKAAELRHSVSSQNIANVNTPGYHALEVRFQDVLAQAENGNGQPTELKSEVVAADGLRERLDGNNVDMDREMSILTKNSIQFEAFAQLLASKFGLMRQAMSNR